MITLNIRKAELNEINLGNVIKAPVIDALKVFWQNSEYKYFQNLEYNGIEHQADFGSVNDLQKYANDVISKITAMVDNGDAIDIGDFDYKIINHLKSKNLKPITEFDFVKFTLNLKEIGDEKIKQKIKDLAIMTPSVALIDASDVTENTFELIYYRKGAFYYCDEPYLNFSTPALTLLENFQTPKSSNFILARFLVDLAKKLKENGIDETFCVNYSENSRKTASVDEIIHCSKLNLEEKKAFVESLKNNGNVQNLAKQQAKDEIKDETNAKRNSLTQKEAKEILDNAKSSVVEVNKIDDKEFDRIFSATNDEDAPKKTLAEIRKEFENKIDSIIEEATKLYGEKEIEKTKMRLERAQKDKERAYEDLKKYIDNGSSILEAIQNIKQKYNEDTVHLASLLFGKDILNAKNKDEIINKLNDNILNLENECKDLNSKLDKKDETISSLKSTMQKKVNEITNMEIEFKETLKQEIDKKEKQMFEKLEIYKVEQEKMIIQIKENAEIEKNDIMTKYQSEIDEFDKENAELNETNKKLEQENQAIKNSLESGKKELELLRQDLETKLNDFEKNKQEFYQVKARENIYKQQIDELKQQLKEANSLLKVAISSKQTEISRNSDSNETKEVKRAKDLLGSI